MRMRRLGTACVVLLAAGAMAMFGVSSGTAAGSPVTIGASLSLSGDFSTDGQAFQRGGEQARRLGVAEPVELIRPRQTQPQPHRALA